MTFSYKNTAINFTSEGKGKAIVLLHGFLENLTMWKATVKELSKKNRVICIDLLGHGQSESLGYIHTMEEQANMIVAVLKHLRLKKYVIVGHSMGGYIALEIAKLVPTSIKGLCLMNSTALPDTKEKQLNRNRGIVAVKQNHKTFIRIAIPMLFSEKNREIYLTKIKDITNEALKMSPQGIIAALEGMKIRKNNSNLYQTTTFPIQMIIGKQDPALEYQSLINQTKNTKVQIVEFSDGHMSHIENKDELIKTLLKFIKLCF